MLAGSAKLPPYTKQFASEYLENCNYGCLARGPSLVKSRDLIMAGLRELQALIHFMSQPRRAGYITERPEPAFVACPSVCV